MIDCLGEERMIRLENVVKVYKSKKGDAVKALDGVSLELGDAGLTFIVGRSGSGKSTLLNILGGLDYPDSGSIKTFGIEVAARDDRVLNAYRNRYVGFIFQDFNLIDNLTVEENIRIALQLQDKPNGHEVIESALSEVGLIDIGRRYPSELSGGQRQRVAIARAIVKNPEIILADEPTGNLDFTTGKEILELLHELSKTRLVVVVTHDLEFAKTYGDRIIEIQDGKIVSDVQAVNGEDTLGNDVQAAENVEKITDKTNVKKTKISGKFVFKFGLGGIKHRKIRFVLSTLLSVVALVMFGLALTLTLFDGDKQIYENIKDHNLKYFKVVADVDADNNSFDIEYENYLGGEGGSLYTINSLDTDVFNKNYPDVKYYERVWLNPFYDIEYYNNFEEPTWERWNGYTFIVKDEQNIYDGGFEILQGSKSLGDDVIYVTDALLYMLLNTKRTLVDSMYGYNNSTHRVENPYYFLIDGKYVNLSPDMDISEFLGKTIYKISIYDGEVSYKEVRNSRGESATVDGVVITDFMDYASRELNSKEQRVYDFMFENVWFSGFMTRGYYFKNLKSTDRSELFFYDGERRRYEMQLSAGSETITLSDDAKIEKEKTRLKLTYLNAVNEDGIVYLPSGNDITITLREYNRLFGTNYEEEDVVRKHKILGSFDFVDRYSLKEELEHVGDEITFQVLDRSGNVRFKVEGRIYDVILNDEYYSREQDEVLVSPDAMKEAQTLNDNTYGIVVKVPENEKECLSLIRALHKRGLYPVVPFSAYVAKYSQNQAVFRLSFLISSGVLIALSVMLLANFMAVNATDRKSEIGVLRALGASRADIAKTFLAEALVIALIIAVLTTAAIVGFSFVLNSILAKAIGAAEMALIGVNGIAVASSVLAAFIVVLLASIIPVWHIGRMTPVNAIKRIS